MIQINCTQCRELLQIDDAFAGGVCRCKFCGAIQTVPKRFKGGNEGGQEAAAAIGANDAYNRRGGTAVDAPSGTGLDDLAGIVASSGLLSGSHLRGQPASKATGAQRPSNGARVAARPNKDANQKTMLMLGGAGGVIAVLLGVIVVMALRDKPAEVAHNPDPTASATANPNPAPVKPDGPIRIEFAKPSDASFLGQKLSERKVLYVLDRGQASLTSGRLEFLKKAVLASVKSLGPGKKFAVMFWQSPNDQAEVFTEFKAATPENVEALRKTLDETYGSGQTRPPHGLTKAFKAGTEALIYVPIKSFLTDDIVKPIMERRADSKLKVYGFSLEQPELAGPLRELAEKTGGAYRDVPLSELRREFGE